MNIAEIKQQLGISALELSYLRDETGKRATDPKTNAPTLWMRNWDDTNRIQLVVHEEVIKKIQAEPNMANLGIKDKGDVESKTSGKSYKLKVLIAYTEADITL